MRWQENVYACKKSASNCLFTHRRDEKFAMTLSSFDVKVMLKAMSSDEKKKASRLFREKVEKMKLARQAASSQVMSAVEFLRQSPKEVRAQPLPGGE